MNAAVISLQAVQVRHGEKVALDIPALDVYAREVLAVIGPNGAGKSTLLQVIAGLSAPDRGALFRHGSPVQPASLVHRRRIALVLQEPLLVDASVLTNATLGLRFRGVRGTEATRRAAAWLERLGVAHLAGRHARTLSGGEAQRVCLARAMVLEPELLLLDEPFGALDAPARSAILDDLQQLLQRTQTTTIFVTHDRDEALQLGDRIAVLLDGHIRQLDSPARVFSSPVDEAVAQFVGVETILRGRIVEVDGGLVVAQTGSQRLELATGHGVVGENVLVCLRPEDITLTPAEVPLTPSSARNRFLGRVTRVAARGSMYHVTVDCGFLIVAMITPRSVEGLGLVDGREVVAAFKATAAHVIRRSAMKSAAQ